MKAQIDYPLLKKNITVELTSEDEERLTKIIEDIKEIKLSFQPPKFSAKKICNKCAYHDLCFI